MSVLTLNEVAAACRKTQQALQKNIGLERFVVGQRSNGGRPAKVYHPDVLTFLGVTQAAGDAVEVMSRKRRNDTGKVRNGKSPELVAYLTKLTFTEFMSCATPDVRSACRRAISKAQREAEAGLLSYTPDEVAACGSSEWLYFNWVNRSSATFRGPAYTEGWAIAHREQWRKWDSAMGSGTNRYTFWKIAENDLGAGAGRGRGRFIMLDDRKTDAWTAKADGTYEMAYAIYAWDVLTGELLWVERAAGDGVSGNDYVRCILGVLYRVGNDCPVWFMENSRAAKAINVKGAVDSLYTDADRNWFAQDSIKSLFKGQAPVVRNTPHIPRDLGKAIGERLFGEVKRWDAQLYPQSYHGAGIHESVQLTRSVTPTLGANTPTGNEYFANLLGEPYNAYLDQPRSSLKEWAKYHKSEPTRRAMIDFYSPATIAYPSAEQTALLLYYAILDRHVVKLTEWGQLKCQINSRAWNLRADELYLPENYRRKLTVIPIPGSANECAIYDAKTADVRFVCIAKDFTGTTAENSSRIRIESRTMREAARQNVRNFTQNNLLADPVAVANARRISAPELPSPEADEPAVVSYVELVDERADERVIDNLSNLF